VILTTARRMTLKTKNKPIEFYRKDSNEFNGFNHFGFQESANRFNVDDESEEEKKKDNSDQAK
jgi:hypothetical protein